MSVSFKVCLNAGNQESEVRKFMADKEVSTSFTHLQEKLFSTFPALRRSNFKIHWTDADGDEVMLTGDEELIIALNEMKGPVYRFSIKTSGEKSQKSFSDLIHPGIICDGCDKPLTGFRYLCLVCPDYDLCGPCEREGLHPPHNMIRMARPQPVWPHQVFRCGNRMRNWEERCRKEPSESSKECNKNRDNLSQGKKVAEHSNTSQKPTIFTVIEHFMTLKDPETTAKKEDETTKTGESIKQFAKFLEMEPENIRNLGEILKAFGVDFKLEETMANAESKKESTNEEEKASNEEPITEDTVEQGKAIEKESEINKEKTVEKAVSIEPEKNKLPAEVEEYGWTVLQEAESEKILNPALSESKTTSTDPDKDTTYVLDSVVPPKGAKIQEALLEMQKLGFTNEGGWLTKLLEAKAGDVGQTMEVLKIQK
eukprot:GFUD01038119.1.p1 GENE.GFUD01038119.1~~GFUD01038119.1.p1  ORF type:complete len:426 (-),score=140.12 GFUD01038119.1:81-1358(-)